MLKKIISGILCLSIALSFSACGKDNENSQSESGNSQSVSDETAAADGIINFTMPVENEKIAVFEIRDYGTIKIKLFPEQCPKGVENFEFLINSGYYDGVTFHRVIKDFMIQGGDSDGDGIGGDSKWGENGFEQEICDNLKHFSGAVAYAIPADKRNRSQFYIVTGLQDINEDYFKEYNISCDDETKQMYYEKGGYPFLDGGYEVFGQVFEGLDVCFKIAETATNSSDRPLEDVVIEYAKMEEYKSEN